MSARRPATLHTLTFCLALFAAACGVGDPKEDIDTTEQELTVCAGANTVDGIDVSTWQGVVDWNAVAASGKKFAIARISDGMGSIDNQWARNWAGIKAAGMIRGAYQFFRPGQDPVAQANRVVAAVGKLGPRELPVMLDIEASDGMSPATIIARAHQWVDIVRNGTGRAPYVYTYKSFWDVQCGGSADFKDLPFHIAAYGPVCPSIPAPWTRWTFFQYSSTGHVPGISGNVDMDKFNGMLAELETFAAGGITDDNCTAQEKANCGAFGCSCVDHVCNGGFCAGSGCSAQHTNNCGAFGCACADNECSGGFCPGTGCSAKETLDCGKVGATCVDHKCAGGASSPGSGCTAKELTDCGKFACGCADHKCGGGYCPGTGCSASETKACADVGKSCNANKCVAAPVVDAGVKPPTPDAGAAKDAGTAPKDAGTLRDAGNAGALDAGTPLADAGVVPPDAGTAPTEPPVQKAVGGCSSTPVNAGWVASVLALLTLRRRARTERRSRA